MYEILPAPGIKLSKITALEDNIALRLATRSLRILAPIPGKQAVGIEVPNKKRDIVNFREIIETSMDACEKDLPLYLGKTISGEPITADLTAMPHLLVAGTTGSGKSVCINTMILSLLYCLSPAECRMIFIDAKVVELKFYDGIPHLLTPVITDPKRALTAMRYCVTEMERRYEQLAKHSSRNIKSYNNAADEKGIEIMPYIVVIIDEFADLMSVSGKEIEALIARLAAKSRAVGIHLVLATQRPSVNVITGIIKANIPARIAFMVTSNVDSRVILDSPGAEKLLGKGDMLFSGSEPFPIRAQGAFVSDEEAEKVVTHLKTLGSPVFVKM
jgi:S-DNA-T family DNA segregation ATPase FtsK/SpoIIIE